MMIRPLLYVVIVFVSWLLGQAARAAEGDADARPNEPRQVVVDVKLITLGESSAQRFRTLANFSDPKQAAKKQKAPSTLLTEAQLRAWLEVFREDRATNVLQMPRLTTLDGQSARVAAGRTLDDGKLEGVQFEVLPQVVRQKKQIQIRTALEFSTMKVGNTVRLVSIQDGEETQEVEIQEKKEQLEMLTLKELMTIPAGHTVVVAIGKIMIEQRTETNACPMLARIPYVSRLFRNVGVGMECREVFVLVSARVVTDKE